MLANENQYTRLGISAGLKDIRAICLDKLSGKRYQDISHLSVGFRPHETIADKVDDLLIDAGITISLHPVDINLSDMIEEKEFDQIKKLIDQLQPVYFEEDLGLWRHRKVFLESHLLNPTMSKDSMNITIENVKKCGSLLNVPIAIENPPIYWVDGDVDFWEYFLYIAEQASCLIAFDIGHFIGYCRSLDKKVYFPREDSSVWKKIVTVHVSGMKSWYWNGIPVWIDRHSESFSSQIQTVTTYCLKRTKSLHCLLMEMEGAIFDVEEKNILTAKSILNQQRDDYGKCK